MSIQTGDTVIFRGGAIPDQVKYSGSDYPSNLIIGKTYVVEGVEQTSSYSNLTLQDTQGKFNSNQFQVAWVLLQHSRKQAMVLMTATIIKLYSKVDVRRFIVKAGKLFKKSGFNGHKWELLITLKCVTLKSTYHKVSKYDPTHVAMCSYWVLRCTYYH